MDFDITQEQSSISHEAIAVALLNNRQREVTDVASFIEQSNLYPEPKGFVSLADQVMLRATKSDGAYGHLFERIGDEKIWLGNFRNTLLVALKSDGRLASVAVQIKIAFILCHQYFMAMLNFVYLSPWTTRRLIAD